MAARGPESPKSKASSPKSSVVSPVKPPAELIAQIGKYEVVFDGVKLSGQAIQDKVDEILGNNRDARLALYKGENNPPTIEARRKFLELVYEKIDPTKKGDKIDKDERELSEIFKELEKSQNPKVLDAYKAALKEEERSVEFRNAAFLNSLKPSPSPEIGAMVGAGASSTGKSSTQGAVMDEVRGILPAPQNNVPLKGKYVLNKDGGIPRETAQMRNFLGQVLTVKGKRFPKDFQKQSELATKGILAKAAKEVGIPVNDITTLTRPLAVKSMVDATKKNYKKNKESVQIFWYINPEDEERSKQAVAVLGARRAWLSEQELSNAMENPAETINLNKALRAEFKKYGASAFERGCNQARLAAKEFLENAKNGIIIEVTHDLMVVSLESGTLQPASAETTTEEILNNPDKYEVMSARDFDSWGKLWKTYVSSKAYDIGDTINNSQNQSIKIPPRLSLKAWLEIYNNPKNLLKSGPLVKQVTKVKLSQRLEHPSGLEEPPLPPPPESPVSRSSAPSSLGSLSSVSSSLGSLSSVSSFSKSEEEVEPEMEEDPKVREDAPPLPSPAAAQAPAITSPKYEPRASMFFRPPLKRPSIFVPPTPKESPKAGVPEEPKATEPATKKKSGPCSKN